MAKPIVPYLPVRGSDSGMPIMAAFDLLGQKWTMRILWQLNQNSMTFRELQQACGQVAPSMLNTRIKQLKLAQLLIITDAGYELTQTGLALVKALDPLRDWSQQWAEVVQHESVIFDCEAIIKN